MLILTVAFNPIDPFDASFGNFLHLLVCIANFSNYLQHYFFGTRSIRNDSTSTCSLMLSI